jgi:hypothetical protein
MKSVLIGTAFSLILASAMAAPSKVEYDLRCEGVVTTTGTDETTNREPSIPLPFTMKLHVDLARNLFCQDTCDAPEHISKILSRNIVFRSIGGPQPKRLWVADDGQFSNTWVEVRVQHDDKSVVLNSAQGVCSKIPDGPVAPAEPVKQKSGATTVNRLSARLPLEELSAREITALMDIENHRPVSAELHTQLHARGLIHLEGDLWVLTGKGEAIITGDRK